MFTKTHKWLIALALFALAACFTGCGGSDSTVSADFTPDPGASLGIEGNLDVLPPGDLPVPQETVSGVSGGAPLGMTEEYESEQVDSEVVESTPLTEEELEEDIFSDGTQFDLNWTAITADGDDPDPKVLPESVVPGSKINLWANYMAAEGALLQFHWQIPAMGLNFLGDPIAHDQAGTYLTKFDYYVPYGSLVGSAELFVDIIDAKGVSLGIIIGPDPDPDPDPDPNPDPDPPPGENPEGLNCGHFDVDTSSFISTIYKDRDNKGSTDGHVHEYDDKYSVVGINCFGFHDAKLHNIDTDIANGKRFKLIVANANLSRGGRLVVNDDYDPADSGSWVNVDDYDNIDLDNLPVYSFTGAAGTTKLDQLGIYFDVDAIVDGGIHPTNTGDVRANVLGPNDEWRNGSLTLQAVEVKANGNDDFKTDLKYSNGGVQGVAKEGLLYEVTIFWHWEGPSYHKAGWDTYSPVGDEGCGTVVVVDEGDTVTPDEYPQPGANHHAQMAWEDVLVKSDYDYNDMVTSMHTEELRNIDQSMVQLNMNVKALARAAGYDSDWQFNLGAAMPGTTAYAIINQYYADGTPHGNQRIWQSSDGVVVPIFVSTKKALPPPRGSYMTNGDNDQPFVDGDYCDVSIIFDPPVPAGTYTPAPYEPEIRVRPSNGSTYVIDLWTKPGDIVDSKGYPHGFIVPDTYAWPEEGVKIWSVYPGFNSWKNWINNQNNPEPNPKWWDNDPTGNKYFYLHLL